MKVATYNVLADAYLNGYGDYSHVDPALLEPGARIDPTIRTIQRVDADIIGLQEVDERLAAKLDAIDQWQTFWTPKGRNKPDGCLMVVKKDLPVESFRSLEYSDRSGSVAQILQVGRVALANTHLKWAPADALNHIGVNQLRELLSFIDSSAVVLLGDCNDRPEGPVRREIYRAGFIDLAGTTLSALVNQTPVAIDMLAVRGMTGENVTKEYDLSDIPNHNCPSDHIPIEAVLKIAA